MVLQEYHVTLRGVGFFLVQALGVFLSLQKSAVMSIQAKLLHVSLSWHPIFVGE
jgi:hypothetical protein